MSLSPHLFRLSEPPLSRPRGLAAASDTPGLAAALEVPASMPRGRRCREFGYDGDWSGVDLHLMWRQS
jgi:hypothetical protein